MLSKILSVIIIIYYYIYFKVNLILMFWLYLLTELLTVCDV